LLHCNMAFAFSNRSSENLGTAPPAQRFRGRLTAQCGTWIGATKTALSKEARLIAVTPSANAIDKLSSGSETKTRAGVCSSVSG
jgi:hypothetical protein